jgi:hypothetical protein
MQTNEDKIAALRRDITALIAALMKGNNLEEIELLDEDELDDPTKILIQCNNGDWCEAVVKKVSLADDGIEIHCEGHYENISAVLDSTELACNPPECLESVRQNIFQTLGLEDDVPANHNYKKLLARYDELENEMHRAIVELLSTYGENGRIVFRPEDLNDGEDITDYEGDFSVTATLWGRHDNPNVDIAEVILGENGTVCAKGIDQATGCMCDGAFEIYADHYYSVLAFILTVLKQQGVEL